MRASRPRLLLPTAAGLVAAIGLATTGPAQESGPNGGVVSHAMVMFGEPKYAEGFEHLSYADPDAPQGGTLRQHVVGSFDSMNPYITAGTSPAGRHLVIETMMGRVWDEPFTLYSLLAESVEMPEDRTWAVFTLRPEARWHDGTPVTAADVQWSIETMMAEGSPRYQRYAEFIAGVTAVDDRTVRVDFTAAANREMPMIVGLWPVLSRAWYQDHVFNEVTLEPALGSGPYRVTEVDPGRRIVYGRVEDYWGAGLGLNRGLYNFDAVAYEYFRDATVAREAFFTGGYDLYGEGSPTQWATGYEVPAVADGRIVKEELANDRPAGLNGLVFNTRRPPFDDIRVRQALAYAFDFPSINQTLFYGAYTRTHAMFDNSPLAFSGVPQGRELALLRPLAEHLPPELFTEPFVVPGTEAGASPRANLATAAGLLAEAGWTVADGRLVKDGAPLAFEILLVDAGDEKVALAFADSLQRLGVTATVRTVDSAQYQERRNTFDFDMIINRWGVTLSPGNEQGLYWSSESADAEGSRNYAGVRSPAVDTLVDRLSDARSAEDLAAAAMALDRVLMWGHYVVPLYHATVDRFAVWDTLCHPATSSLYGTVIEAWYACPAD